MLKVEIRTDGICLVRLFQTLAKYICGVCWCAGVFVCWSSRLVVKPIKNPQIWESICCCGAGRVGLDRYAHSFPCRSPPQTTLAIAVMRLSSRRRMCNRFAWNTATSSFAQLMMVGPARDPVRDNPYPPPPRYHTMNSHTDLTVLYAAHQARPCSTGLKC